MFPCFARGVLILLTMNEKWKMPAFTIRNRKSLTWYLALCLLYECLRGAEFSLLSAVYCHKTLLTRANAAWNERNCLTDRVTRQMSTLPHMARKILSGRSSLFPDSRNFRVQSFVGWQLNPRYKHNQRNREADSVVPFDARTWEPARLPKVWLEWFHKVSGFSHNYS